MRRIRVYKLNDESGMVSIMVTMILIIVMTLIVLAMSQDSNRQQRQSLDRQLSDQAFYNAESGINDWKNYLEVYSSDPTLPIAKTTCTGAFGGPTTPTPVPGADIVAGDNSNQSSCVLYDRAPETVEYSKLQPGDSRTVELAPEGGGTIDNLTFGWTYNNLTGCGGINLVNTLPASCTTAGLEVALIDPNVTPLKRSTLLDNSYIGYLLPTLTGVSTDIFSNRVGSGNQGGRVLTKCIASGCSMTLIGVNKSKLILHLSSLYTAPDKIVISGKKPDGTAVKFVGAQIMIDSTGKSQDILRRVRVRVPSENASSAIGLTALRTTDPICKLITVDKGAKTATLEAGPAGTCKTN